MDPFNAIFKCPNCRKAFTHQYKLRVHMMYWCNGGSSTLDVTSPATRPLDDYIPSTRIPKKGARRCMEESKIIESSQPPVAGRKRVISESDDDSDMDLINHVPNKVSRKNYPNKSPNLQCKMCKITFKRSDNLKRHLKSACRSLKPSVVDVDICEEQTTQEAHEPHASGRVQDHRCPHCDKSFMYKYNIQKHIKNSCLVLHPGKAVKAIRLQRGQINPMLREDVDIREDQTTQEAHESHASGRVKDYRCPHCDKSFMYKGNIQVHIKNSCLVLHSRKVVKDIRLRRGQINPMLRDDVLKTQSAYKNYLTNYLILNNNKTVETTQFLEDKREAIKKILEQEIVDKSCIKFNLTLEPILQAPDGTVTDWGVVTENEALFVGSEVDEVIDIMFNSIRHRLEEQMIKGSGWSIVSLQSILLKSSKYEPLRGSSYIPLPRLLASKRALVNPQNLDDNQCFKWSVLSSLETERDAHRINKLRRFENQFNWEGLLFPVALSDIKIFEKHNDDVSVCVYALDEDDKIYPVRYSVPKARHIDLLLLQDENKFHYTYIKYFGRLFNTQISKHEHEVFICKRCLVHYNDEQLLEDHMSHCVKHPLARVIMPHTKRRMVNGEQKWFEPKIEFKNSERSIPVPICIYADSEALLKPFEGPYMDMNNDASNTIKRQHHVAMSFGYIVSSSVPVPPNIPLTPIIIRDEHPTKSFINQLLNISKECKSLYTQNTNMNELSAEEKIRQDTAKNCYMCDKPFEENDEAVRDHCHITGNYRGPAHNSCNLNASNPNFLPVYLHNLSKYDAHFIIKELGDIDAEIRVIPNTTECMISFSIVPKDGVEIRFIDSCRFMASSLDSLVKNLEKHQFVNVQRHFGSTHMDLLRRKGIFCYDYVDDNTKLKETRLPPRHDFHSKLYECEISEAEYQHAQDVWNTFECKTLGEYSDLYLKLDVLLLADVFEAFRNVCMETYHLDPCWYYTAPGLAWDASLRFTKVNLELIQDEEMLFMIERGIRGGIAQCSKRFASVGNKYLDAEHQQSNDCIAYLDANNLYGWAMSQHLPTHDFRWDNINKEDIKDLYPKGWRGYILEVDVEYPETLHDRHSDLPFLPENRIPPGGKNPKLLTTLYHKTKYVIHYRALQQAMAHGLKVTRVHRTISFRQSQWLKPYIELNTAKRKQSKNAFEKDFFKLMNNAVYGKTMENVRNRINMEIVNDVNRLRKLIKSPFFKSRVIYDENLCTVTSQRKKVVMNKAIYVGMSILDISKTLMYQFHYEKMLPRYGESLSLMYMDTDSFVYHIRGRDFYTEMRKHLQDFDTSDYPPDHPCYSISNKKVLGKFKDEANAVPVKSFVGLRAKMYAMKYGGKVLKRAKGVKKYALSKKVSFNDYVRCLKFGQTQRTAFRMIRSNEHELYTIEMNKISLSAHDDKRFILPNKVDTLPHGHYKINFLIEEMESDDTSVNLDHIILDNNEIDGDNE